jgi:uncharacterized membrane protein YdfJ with MMPL/SSD domain
VQGTTARAAREAAVDRMMRTVAGVLVLAVVLVAGWTGHEIRGTTGAIVGVVAAVVLIGLAWTVAVLTGSLELLRRRLLRRG